MPPRPWTEDLPLETEAVQQFPECDEDDVELRDAFIAGASMSSAQLADKPELVNVVLRQCDIAGYVASRGRAERVAVTGGRLRGVTWAAGLLRDIQLDGVTGSDVSLRFSTLRRVVFRDCDLPGLDLTEVEFDDVRFERCNLTGAQFNGAKVTSLRLEKCDLSGCTGAGALSGASVHPDDVATLATSLAEAAGMTVETRLPG